MATIVSALDAPDSVAAGTPQNVRNLRDIGVQVYGTFVATFDVEASLDGTNFSPVQGASGLSAPVTVDVPNAAVSVRINTTAYTSGTLEANVSGDSVRGD